MRFPANSIGVGVVGNAVVKFLSKHSVKSRICRDCFKDLNFAAK